MFDTEQPPPEIETLLLDTQSGLTCTRNLLRNYKPKLLSGDVPQLIEVGTTFSGFEVGPGLICLLGAPPGSGKTTIAMQIVFDALLHNPTLRVVVGNAESSFETLANREIVSMTGIDSWKVRFGRLTDSERQQVERAFESLDVKCKNLRWMAEVSIPAIDKLAGLDPGLLVIDYAQKVVVGEEKEGLAKLMASLRRLALEHNWAVLLISATSRPTATNKELGLNSFRGSSELEYNADSAYVIQDNGPTEDDSRKSNVVLKCVKNRHGAPLDHRLIFDRPRQRFIACSQPWDSDFRVPSYDEVPSFDEEIFA